MKKTRQKRHEKEFVPTFLTNNVYETYQDTINGQLLVNIFLPEEVLLYIFSHINPTEILSKCLVCHKWNKLIKSCSLWSIIYRRKYKREPNKLPWFLLYSLLSTECFDRNLLLNGNGQNGLENWTCKAWEGDNYVENPPIGVDPLPLNVPEFNDQSGCFATSYFMGCKKQIIKLSKNKLFRYILNYYKPHIYISEWIAGRFDCGCIYKLQCELIGTNLDNIKKPFVSHYKTQWEKANWKKMELIITEYPDNIEAIVFENQARNTQTWKGHFGCKMAGGLVKFLFESIDPACVNKHGLTVAKEFSRIQFTANGVSQDNVTDHYTEWNTWNGEDYEESYYFMP